MKRFSAFASIMLSSILFLTTGCYVNHSEPKSEGASEQAEETEVEKAEKAEKAEKGEKGKFEMSEEVPPAPGDEEFAQKQVQKQQEPAQKQEQEEPVQKQTQKQSQKQAL